jgi:sugar phosphate isomerase/epimerase
MVASYRAVAQSAECKPLKISVEYKPTDEQSRFSFIPSTGSALLLADAVGAPNFGLTLDVGHMLAAGEIPRKVWRMLQLETSCSEFNSATDIRASAPKMG